MKRAEARGEVLGEVGIQGGGVMVRLVGKLMRVIDKPWKVGLWCLYLRDRLQKTKRLETKFLVDVSYRHTFRIW